MTPGIRSACSAAFTASALLMACAPDPDPAQLSAVDQLITATDGALLTLNELDRNRYLRADSLFALSEERFRARLSDTLAPTAAQALGSQWIALRGAAAMGKGHERILAELSAAAERLRLLRTDLAAGAISPEGGRPLIAAEQRRHAETIAGVHAVMDNYRLLQHAWDRRDTVEALLANAPLP